MKSTSPKWEIFSLLGASAILFVTWWINGRDQTWLFAMSGIIVLTAFIPIFFKKNKK